MEQPLMYYLSKKESTKFFFIGGEMAQGTCKHTGEFRTSFFIEDCWKRSTCTSQLEFSDFWLLTVYIVGYSFFTGGATQCIAWVPPNLVEESLANYLAVSVHRTADVPRHSATERPRFPASLQIWHLGQFQYVLFILYASTLPLLS